MKKTAKYFSYGSLAVLIVVMAAATVLERLHGTEFALRWFYHSPVFIALWAVLAVSGMYWLISRGGARHPFTFLMHVSFVLILAGALVTHLTGLSGAISLRTGEDSGTVELEDGMEMTMPFSLRLDEFVIERYPDSMAPKDYRSEVTVLPSGEPFTISMNHILKYDGYRFYQADYDEDMQGSILAVSHDPWGIGVTYAGYLLLLVSMIGFFFEKDSYYRKVLMGLPVLPRWLKTVLYVLGSLLLVGCFWMMCRRLLFKPLMPVLRSPLLVFHIVAMIISYTIFALVAILGVAGLAAPSTKTKENLRDISLSVLYPAVFLIASGIFIGAVWANISWGNYWGWDPKETWALITMLVYSFALHGNSIKAFRKPGFFHAYTIVALLSVLVTYFGVNLLLGGIHSYM
jgi:ABC-type transport system involved in cytochrome c biogenesis permease subunit/uncharacterized membrane protein